MGFCQGIMTIINKTFIKPLYERMQSKRRESQKDGAGAILKKPRLHSSRKKMSLEGNFKRGETSRIS